MGRFRPGFFVLSVLTALLCGITDCLSDETCITAVELTPNTPVSATLPGSCDITYYLHVPNGTRALYLRAAGSVSALSVLSMGAVSPGGKNLTDTGLPYSRSIVAYESGSLGGGSSDGSGVYRGAVAPGRYEVRVSVSSLSEGHPASAVYELVAVLQSDFVLVPGDGGLIGARKTSTGVVLSWTPAFSGDFDCSKVEYAIYAKELNASSALPDAHMSTAKAVIDNAWATGDAMTFPDVACGAAAKNGAPGTIEVQVDNDDPKRFGAPSFVINVVAVDPGGNLVAYAIVETAVKAEGDGGLDGYFGVVMLLYVVLPLLCITCIAGGFAAWFAQRRRSRSWGWDDASGAEAGAIAQDDARRRQVDRTAGDIPLLDMSPRAGNGQRRDRKVRKKRGRGASKSGGTSSATHSPLASPGYGALDDAPRPPTLGNE